MTNPRAGRMKGKLEDLHLNYCRSVKRCLICGARRPR